MQKILKAVMIVAMLVVPTIVIINVTTQEVEAGTWRKSNQSWWYQNDDNTYPANTWQKIGDTWYHFNDSGYMSTGWVNDEGMWYYMKPSGAMATGWIKSGSNWYFMSGSGSMATGWVKSGSNWYFMNRGGSMATGWVQDGSKWYHLKASGAMSKNAWVGNYYLGNSGAMAVNQWIGNYYVGGDGEWIPNHGGISSSGKHIPTYWNIQADETSLCYHCPAILEMRGGVWVEVDRNDYDFWVETVLPLQGKI